MPIKRVKKFDPYSQLRERFGAIYDDTPGYDYEPDITEFLLNQGETGRRRLDEDYEKELDVFIGIATRLNKTLLPD